MTNVTPATTSDYSTPVTSPVVNGTGKTTINDAVIAKVAGIAAAAVPGVFALGGGAARAIGALRGALNQQDRSQGISVEVGETQVAADVTIVAEYPVALQGVADDVRTAVIDAIENLVGMEVTEVNVTINDVHIPSDDQDKDDKEEARVQ
jgi:uncharacterized alkaline shock family protein YloU